MKKRNNRANIQPFHSIPLSQINPLPKRPHRITQRIHLSLHPHFRHHFALSILLFLYSCLCWLFLVIYESSSLSQKLGASLSTPILIILLSLLIMRIPLYQRPNPLSFFSVCFLSSTVPLSYPSASFNPSPSSSFEQVPTSAHLSLLPPIHLPSEGCFS